MEADVCIKDGVTDISGGLAGHVFSSSGTRSIMLLELDGVKDAELLSKDPKLLDDAVLWTEWNNLLYKHCSNFSSLTKETKTSL